VSFSRKTIILDCGASRVALGEFSQSRGRLRLDHLAVESFPAPAGYGDEWLDQTRIALTNLRARRERGGPCVLVLPGHVVLTKFIQVPRASPEQRQKVIHFESEQNLPLALSQLAWDSVIAAEQESGLEVMLAAAQLKKVEPLCAAARAAGFVPRRVLPAALATLATFRLIHDRPAEPAIVMNLGAFSTTFVFVEAGRFFVRSFALGGRSASGEEQSGTAAGMATRLALELKRSTLFFRRNNGIADPTQVYLTGGGCQLTGLVEALSERLKLPVQRLDLAGVVAAAPGIEGELPTTVTDLVGAAATELRDGHAVLNLLPPLRQRQMMRRRRQALAVAALALVAVPASAWLALRTPAHRVPSFTSPMEHRAVAPPPVSEPVRLAAATESEAPPAAKETQAAEPIFGVELLGVTTEPYGLELAGYLGGPDDYLAVFVTPGRPGTLVARAGQHFEELGVELRNFELRRLPSASEEEANVYEVTAFATLHEDRTSKEVVLDTRNPTYVRRQAMLRLPAETEPRIVQEGEGFATGTAVYRIDRVQIDPPVVTVAKQIPGAGAREVRELRPIAASARVSATVRAGTGGATSTR
jgi:type IV pilus assembly protein PilM